MMITRAAVMERPSCPLVVADLELDPPRRDEVLVRVLASGICRSDLSFMSGKWPAPLPIVLGHEGAGEIEAVGDGVDQRRIGERVVLTFAPPCGRCRFCLEGRANLCLEAAACMDAGTMRDGTMRLHRGEERVHHLALVSSFAEHAVVPANGAIPVTDRLEPGLACLLGCGGVGRAAGLGAGLISAQPVIADDPLPEKRAMAVNLGATHAVDPDAGDPVEQIREIVPGGVDHAFEAIGIPAVADQAFRSVRDGGTTVLIGQPAMGVKAGFDVYDVTQFEHTILGSNLGGANPALHVPGLARLADAGRLDLTSLVTHRMPLEQINEAAEITASGVGGRVVIEL
jgi:S-(hydroxymethyl)glutathione dehydrogenase/alcohol dehydrogenase